MKKILLFTIMFFALGLNSYAQDAATGQGVILIKGNSNLNLTLSDDFPIEVNLGAGYFLKDNICLGGDLSLETEKDAEDKLQITVGISPFARYYFQEKFFGGLGAFKFGDDWKLKLQGGYLFYLTDLIVIEPILEYPIIDGANLTINIGISIYY